VLFGTAPTPEGGYPAGVWFARQAISHLEDCLRLLTSDTPLPRTSLWLIVVGLVALSGSAMVVRVGVLLLVLVALVVPMFAIALYSSLRSETVPAVTSKIQRGSEHGD
jgi:hypothetical protein